MIRLAVLIHDDTREPVAVRQIEHDPYGTFRLVEGVSHAGLSLTGGIFGSGPEADACKALLLRERAHWMAAQKPTQEVSPPSTPPLRDPNCCCECGKPRSPGCGSFCSDCIPF